MGLSTLFSLLLCLGFIKGCLWLWEDTESLEKWQRPFCRLHETEELNCSEVLPIDK